MCEHIGEMAKILKSLPHDLPTVPRKKEKNPFHIHAELS